MTIEWGFLSQFQEPKPVKIIAHVTLPITEARLCVDCETLSDAKGDTCPVCAASNTLYPLSRFLGTRHAESKVFAYPVEEKPINETGVGHTAYSIEEKGNDETI